MGGVIVWRGARLGLILVSAGLPLTALQARPAAADLTIEIGGDLLAHGGAAVVYPLPTSAEDVNAAAGGSGPSVMRVDERYAEVQFRDAAGETYAYQPRPVAGTIDPKAHATQVLTVIGTVDGRGPQMCEGSQNAYLSGERIVRVPALAELFGPNEATRTAARWGRTQGDEAVSPADRRSARAFVAVVEHGPKPMTL